MFRHFQHSQFGYFKIFNTLSIKLGFAMAANKQHQHRPQVSISPTMSVSKSQARVGWWDFSQAIAWNCLKLMQSWCGYLSQPLFLAFFLQNGAIKYFQYIGWKCWGSHAVIYSFYLVIFFVRKSCRLACSFSSKVLLTLVVSRQWKNIFDSIWWVIG